MMTLAELDYGNLMNYAVDGGYFAVLLGFIWVFLRRIKSVVSEEVKRQTGSPSDHVMLTEALEILRAQGELANMQEDVVRPIRDRICDLADQMKAADEKHEGTYKTFLNDWSNLHAALTIGFSNLDDTLKVGRLATVLNEINYGVNGIAPDAERMVLTSATERRLPIRHMIEEIRSQLMDRMGQGETIRESIDAVLSANEYWRDSVTAMDKAETALFDSQNELHEHKEAFKKLDQLAVTFDGDHDGVAYRAAAMSVIERAGAEIAKRHVGTAIEPTKEDVAEELAAQVEDAAHWRPADNVQIADAAEEGMIPFDVIIQRPELDIRHKVDFSGTTPHVPECLCTTCNEKRFARMQITDAEKTDAPNLVIMDDPVAKGHKVVDRSTGACFCIWTDIFGNYVWSTSASDAILTMDKLAFADEIQYSRNDVSAWSQAQMSVDETVEHLLRYLPVDDDLTPPVQAVCTETRFSYVNVIRTTMGGIKDAVLRFKKKKKVEAEAEAEAPMLHPEVNEPIYTAPDSPDGNQVDWDNVIAHLDAQDVKLPSVPAPFKVENHVFRYGAHYVIASNELAAGDILLRVLHTDKGSDVGRSYSIMQLAPSFEIRKCVKVVATGRVCDYFSGTARNMLGILVAGDDGYVGREMTQAEMDEAGFISGVPPAFQAPPAPPIDLDKLPSVLAVEASAEGDKLPILTLKEAVAEFTADTLKLAQNRVFRTKLRRLAVNELADAEAVRMKHLREGTAADVPVEVQNQIAWLRSVIEGVDISSMKADTKVISGP